MKYNLIIHEIRNIEALTILAQQLKKTHGITLQQALKQLDHLPVLFATGLDESSAQHYIEQYHQFGVTLRAEPASQDKTKDASIVNLSPVRLHEHMKPKETTQQTTTLLGKHKTASDKSRSTSNKSKAIILLGLLTVAVCFIYIFFSHKGLFIKPFSTTPTLSGDAFTRSKTSDSRQIHPHSTLAPVRNVSAEKQQQSAIMTDSAQMFPDDINMIINFYKVAISFNKYNFKAWSGLCAAYKNAGMKKEYNQCLNDIEELFGKQALSVSGIVQRYGPVHDIYTSEKSVLTITYASDANAQDQLTRETWSIIHLLLQNGTDSSITLISTNNNKVKSIVHLRPGMHVGTYEEFIKEASINIFMK